ncbi:MAG: Smr/MutS family protein [Oscillospiraceae bacterium]|nr:Smr/MutS family protein [Oscillospiraceae bacterium]
MRAGIYEIDLHGASQQQAYARIDAELRCARASVYRIRIIHGYNGGTALRDMIRKRFRSHPRVLRVEIGLNPGTTELVLREF